MKKPIIASSSWVIMFLVLIFSQYLHSALPGQATNPNPADQSINVPINGTLSWTAASGATSYEVRIQPDTGSVTSVTITGTSCSLGNMTTSTLYWWRINPINGSGKTTGALWSFTTAASQTGTIYVNMNISSSYSLSGPYSVSGCNFSSITNCPVGTYTITYAAANGYTTPSSQTLTLSAGGSITFTGNYVAATGNIQVSSNMSGATFYLSGPGNYSGSGTSYLFSNIPTGTYYIYYGAINGYQAPAGHNIYVTAGNTSQESGNYINASCTINVSTNNSNATFSINGPNSYSGSGTYWSQSNVPVGTYTIDYGSINGYTTPSSQTSTVYAYGSISFSGNYSGLGTINVNTNNSNATFSISGPSNYSGSGTSWSQSNAPVGTYTITYNSINGYTTPSSQTFTLSAGGSITFTGNYTATPVGTIQVSTNNASAAFSISGPNNYSGSGTSWSQSGASVGTYTITFSNIGGYTTPSSQTYTLATNSTISFSGNYVVVPTGTINVSTNNASAAFSISGPNNYNGNGASWSQSSVPVGTYTITYGAINGYNTPSSQTFTLSTNSTISFSGNYSVTPTVSILSPSTGPNSSATTISITGSGFFGGVGSNAVTAIKFDNGTTSLTGYSVGSDSVITGAIVPSGVAVGTYNVLVTALGGTNTTSTIKFVVTLTGSTGTTSGKTKLIGNLFNPVTGTQMNVQYTIPADSNVKITVYTSSGKLIRTLLSQLRTAGSYSDINWDGKDDSGNMVASGVYTVFVEAGSYKDKKRVVIVK